MIGIYKITSPTKKVYIGQSIDIEYRFKSYKRFKCKNQPILYRSLLKHSFDKHKFEILCECELNELNDKERYYQDIFSSVGKNGMNCILTNSSDRSGKHSEESKLKMRKPRNKCFSDGCKKRQLGRKYSEETKLKMSISRKGRTFSDESKLKMSDWQKKIILNTQTGIFYLGVKEASESVNVNLWTLHGYLNGQRPNKTSLIYI